MNESQVYLSLKCFVGLLFVVFGAKNLIHILLTLIHIVLMYILESVFV